MTDAPDRAPEPTRLDRAITGTGVGAASALAALLMMSAFFGFAGSAPAADNVGEEGIASALGFVGLGLSLAVSLPTGWVLARRYSVGLRTVLRALPILFSIAWAILAAVLLPVGLQLVYGLRIGWTLLHQFVLYSVFTAGALPIGIGLLVTFIVLLNKRDRRQLAEARPRCSIPARHWMSRRPQDGATMAPHDFDWSVDPECALGYSEAQLRAQLGSGYPRFGAYVEMKAHPVCAGPREGVPSIGPERSCDTAHGHVFYVHDVICYVERT